MSAVVPEEVRPPDMRPAQADPREWTRLRSRLVVTDRCTIWVGAVADDGYGRFWSKSRTGLTALPDDGSVPERAPVVRPSRWMWHAHHGPIPTGRVVCHACDLTLCARLECLRLGDQVDNLLDASRRDRITHLGRIGKADKRGTAAAARAVRTAVCDALARGVVDPVELGAVVQAAQADGDPYANQPRLF